MSEFAIGAYVRKKSGAFWEGTVVGHYSTDQTPDGVAVQLFGWEDGPVQIYPASALEPCDPTAGRLAPQFLTVNLSEDELTELQVAVRNSAPGKITVATPPPSTHVEGISDDIRSYLEGVTGVVEANSFETMCLWQQWRDMGKTWVSTGHGYLATVGHVGDMPVCLSILSATVEGEKILFIDPTSQVVDYRMVEEWLKTHVVTALRDDGYLNRADAMNFSNVFGRRAALATTEGKEG